MEFTIESNIPFPDPTRRASSPETTAIMEAASKMEVGQSFLFPVDVDPDLTGGEKAAYISRVRNRLFSPLARVRSATNYRFASRIVPGGLRIWRTK